MQVSQAVPRDVIYRMLFREIAAYQNEADQLAAQSKPDAFVRNYHQQVLQLTSDQAAQLIPIALACAQQIQSFDAQASAIINVIKQQYRRSPGILVPPPPTQLQQLEGQRSAAAIASADSIAVASGPEAFASFEALVQQHIGAGLKIGQQSVK